MAIIKCKECGSEVSTTALACPKCGAVVRVGGKKRWKDLSGLQKVGAIIGAILVGVFAFNFGTAIDPKQNVPAAAIAKSWSYASTEPDKMTGSVTKQAALVSDTVLQFEFPYNGGSVPTLTILRSSGSKGDSVLLRVEKSQILTCISDCYVEVKFDDGKIEKYPTWHPRDGTTNMLFINNEKKFIEHLIQSKRLIISADFYKHPVQQMEFATAGLKW